jgi:hypothetical protein
MALTSRYVTAWLGPLLGLAVFLAVDWWSRVRGWNEIKTGFFREYNIFRILLFFAVLAFVTCPLLVVSLDREEDKDRLRDSLPLFSMTVVFLSSLRMRFKLKWK